MTQESVRIEIKPQQSTVIASASSERRMAEARRLAAAALCTGTGAHPCGMCRDCRKALQGIHPDVSLYTIPEKKKEIPVDMVREISAEAVILPGEAVRRVFIIEEADTMNLNAQNAALKLLEEPPNGAVFILCVSSALRLLETVRSRCAIITLNSETEPVDGETEKAALEYLGCVARRDDPALLVWCSSREGLDGNEITKLLEGIRSVTVDALCFRRTIPGVDRELLMATERLMEKCITYRKSNVAGKMVLTYLSTNPAIDEINQKK